MSLSDVKADLDVLIDAAQIGSQEIKHLLANFCDSFAEHFSVDSKVLLDKGRMSRFEPRCRDDIASYTIFVRQCFTDVKALEHALILSDQDRRERMLANDLKKITVGIQKIVELTTTESAESDYHESWNRLSEALGMGFMDHDEPVMGVGGMDACELDMDALRQDFMCSFQDSMPKAQTMGSKGLFTLLMQLDPEYSAELFAPDEDEEMLDTYSDWGQRVYAPGAEHDEEDPL